MFVCALSFVAHPCLPLSGFPCYSHIGQSQTGQRLPRKTPSVELYQIKKKGQPEMLWNDGDAGDRGEQGPLTTSL